MSLSVSVGVVWEVRRTGGGQGCRGAGESRWDGYRGCRRTVLPLPGLRQDVPVARPAPLGRTAPDTAEGQSTRRVGGDVAGVALVHPQHPVVVPPVPVHQDGGTPLVRPVLRHAAVPLRACPHPGSGGAPGSLPCAVVGRDTGLCLVDRGGVSGASRPWCRDVPRRVGYPYGISSRGSREGCHPPTPGVVTSRRPSRSSEDPTHRRGWGTREGRRSRSDSVFNVSRVGDEERLFFGKRSGILCR